jgi:hypothetical protein
MLDILNNTSVVKSIFMAELVTKEKKKKLVYEIAQRRLHERIG